MSTTAKLAARRARRQVRVRTATLVRAAQTRPDFQRLGTIAVLAVCAAALTPDAAHAQGFVDQFNGWAGNAVKGVGALTVIGGAKGFYEANHAYKEGRAGVEHYIGSVGVIILGILLFAGSTALNAITALFT